MSTEQLRNELGQVLLDKFDDVSIFLGQFDRRVAHVCFPNHRDK
jgi:hypothetical protein